LIVTNRREAICTKTANSILISKGARLAPFDIRELRDLMKEDELELDYSWR
jgi:traG/traD family protein